MFNPLCSAEAATETLADCPGAIVAGLTWQPLAGAVHVSVSGLLSPPTAVVNSVRLAAVPGPTELVTGLSAMVKSGAGTDVTVTVAEAE